jgi:hypothetical protein
MDTIDKITPECASRRHDQCPSRGWYGGQAPDRDPGPGCGCTCHVYDGD